LRPAGAAVEIFGTPETLTVEEAAISQPRVGNPYPIRGELDILSFLKL
jgi:hypothetical protein